MATEIYTDTKCDKCGALDKRKGAETYTPVGWGSLSMSVRQEGSGWTNQGPRVEAVLCPTCSNAVRKLIGMQEYKPKRERR